jgi:excisionase family DNA binding protein
VPENLPRLWTVAELAELFRVTPKTIERWIKRRTLVAHRIHGRLRVSDADLREFLAARRDN